MKFAGTICLLVQLLVSAMDAQLQCDPFQDMQPTLYFFDRTDTDYAMMENSIAYNLNAVTLCLFAKDNPSESSDDNQCPYSYAVSGINNEFTFFAVPNLRVLIHGNKRIVDVGLEDGNWHHICFTWSAANGDYEFFKDGVSVGGGSGLYKGGHISSGGTTVIGQDQDTVGGGFDAAQAFVGDVTEVNVWGTVLSESDIKAQANNCHISQGSVTSWLPFNPNTLHGGVVMGQQF